MNSSSIISTPKITTRQTFKVCMCFTRRFKFRVLEPPKEVKDVFERYSNNGHMTVEDFVDFLTEVQGEQNAKPEDAKAIIDNINHLKIFHRNGLHLETFFRYLLGDLNLAHTPSVINQYCSQDNYLLYILYYI